MNTKKRCALLSVLLMLPILVAPALANPSPLEALRIKVEVDVEDAVRKVTVDLDQMDRLQYCYTERPRFECGDLDHQCHAKAFDAAGAALNVRLTTDGVWEAARLTFDLTKEVLTAMFGGKALAEIADVTMRYLDSESWSEFLGEMGEYGAGQVGQGLAGHAFDEDFLAEQIGGKLAEYLYDEIVPASGSLAPYNLQNCGPISFTKTFSLLENGSIEFALTMSGDCGCQMGLFKTLGAFEVKAKLELAPHVTHEASWLFGTDTIKVVYRASEGALPRYEVDADCCAEGVGYLPPDDDALMAALAATIAQSPQTVAFPSIPIGDDASDPSRELRDEVARDRRDIADEHPYGRGCHHPAQDVSWLFQGGGTNVVQGGAPVTDATGSASDTFGDGLVQLGPGPDEPVGNAGTTVSTEPIVLNAPTLAGVTLMLQDDTGTNVTLTQSAGGAMFQGFGQVIPLTMSDGVLAGQSGGYSIAITQQNGGLQMTAQQPNGVTTSSALLVTGGQ